MDLKKISIIINPASGKADPILAYLCRAFAQAGIEWEPHITRESTAAFSIAKELAGRAELIAVYGGDGTVTEVARALYRSDTAMAIIPGGTANVMAKELNIPLDTREAISLLLSRDCVIKEIDMGLANGHPFLLRVNMGILADMVTEASSDLKDTWGQWAYGITAFQNMQQQDVHDIHCRIDGKDIDLQAIALTVTNAGNIGKQGYSFLPDISVTDGLLDMIVLDKTDLLSLLKVTGSMLFQKDSEVLKHWRAKEITISMKEDTPFLLDDEPHSSRRLTIQVAPSALKILLPAKK